MIDYEEAGKEVLSIFTEGIILARKLSYLQEIIKMDWQEFVKAYGKSEREMYKELEGMNTKGEVYTFAQKIKTK